MLTATRPISGDVAAERIILHARLHQHGEVLAMYLLQLNQPVNAVRYCLYVLTYHAQRVKQAVAAARQHQASVAAAAAAQAAAVGAAEGGAAVSKARAGQGPAPRRGANPFDDAPAGGGKSSNPFDDDVAADDGARVDAASSAASASAAAAPYLPADLDLVAKSSDPAELLRRDPNIFLAFLSVVFSDEYVARYPVGSAATIVPAGGAETASPTADGAGGGARSDDDLDADDDLELGDTDDELEPPDVSASATSTSTSMSSGSVTASPPQQDPAKPSPRASSSAAAASSASVSGSPSPGACGDGLSSSSAAAVGRPPTLQPIREARSWEDMAFAVLSIYAAYIDPLLLVHVLPPSIPVAKVLPYFARILPRVHHSRRHGQVTRALARMLFQKTKSALLGVRHCSFLLTHTARCPECMKPIGERTYVSAHPVELFIEPATNALPPHLTMAIDLVRMREANVALPPGSVERDQGLVVSSGGSHILVHYKCSKRVHKRAQKHK